jgi:hypothetical protein
MARRTRPVGEARPATLAATRAAVIEHVFSFEPMYVFAKGFTVRPLRDRLTTFTLLPRRRAHNCMVRVSDRWLSLTFVTVV